MAFNNIRTLTEEQLLHESKPFIESNTINNDRFPEKRFYSETPADDIAGIPAFNPNGNNNKKVINKDVYVGTLTKTDNGEYDTDSVVFPYRSTYNGYNVVGRNIDGVIFTEYSTYKKWNDKDHSFQNQPTGGFRAAFSNESDKVIEGLLNGTTAYLDESGHGHLLDGINKGISIMFVNWNGVIIDRGDFNTGRDKIVSDSAEFLTIINNLTNLAYDNIIKFNKEITNGKLGTTSNNDLTLTKLDDIYGLLQSIVTLVQSNIVNEKYNIDTVEIGKNNTPWGHHVKRTFVRKVDIGQSIDNVFAIPVDPAVGTGRTEKIEDYECWDILYVNTSDEEININIENNADSTKNDNIPSGIKLKVPDGEVIELSIPKGGYAELNYLRIGNDIYVRGA